MKTSSSARVSLPGVIVALLLAVVVMKTMPVAAQEGLSLPAPAIDMPASQASSE